MSKREIQYAVGGSVAVMLATCIPYLIVWWPTPQDMVFPWVLFNSDDHGVYFAWMRQAADGQLLFRNLFTTDPQRGIYLHSYFLLLGWLSRLTGLEIPLAYHVGRFFFGALTLVLVYRLAALFAEEVRTRRIIFWVTALSSGLGWVGWTHTVSQSHPVDTWQPEALIFPSLYVNGLFCVSLALMLGVVICLLLAERAPNSSGWKWAVGAGLCGLALGNIHSYDVIHLTLAWVFYLVGKGVLQRRVPVLELKLALLAAAVALPSVAHMAWLYKTEPVFQARADTATLSPAPHLYLLGFGLLVPLAAWGGWLILRGGEPWKPELRKRLWAGAPIHAIWSITAAVLLSETGHRNWVWIVPVALWGVVLFFSKKLPWSDRNARVLLPVAWVLAGIAAAYLPFAFQRKMVMGTHLPLALLAGLAVADLAGRAAAGFKRPGAAPVFAALAVLALLPTNFLFLYRDVHLARTEGRTSTGTHPVYWPASDQRAWQWLHKNAPPGAALLTFPFNGVMAPASTGRPVYAGHWGETPNFKDRIPEAVKLYWGPWTPGERKTFLQQHGIRYVLFGPIEQRWVVPYASEGGYPPAVVSIPRDPNLRPVFKEGETTLYEVLP